MSDSSAAQRFVVDTMLGRLARWLRAMGYDTLYPGPSPGRAGDRRLLKLARLEGRVLVTRDRMLARLASPRGCLVSAEDVDQQILEVVRSMALSPPETDWLSRCLDCNALLESRPREGLEGLVPLHVFATQWQFMACAGCGRIYWRGTHAERMLARLRRLLGREGGG